ncbi:alpha/beta hydrolase family protein [Haloglomus litoreum]|uniref:alpha/beta hydrolase family protein n=1 Tax=Haloglomus litoreum TaxID=3034026 RepID=UPI0023E892A4|nr:hypothetical protein [Haloglomus sp. DT116]
MDDHGEAADGAGRSRRSVLRSAGAAAAGMVTLAGTASAAEDAGHTEPTYPSVAWFQREQRNYAKTQEAPREQATDPAFQQHWQAQSARNLADFRTRTVEEPRWNSGGNLCKEYAEQCVGDPFSYEAGTTYGDRHTYDGIERRRVAFHDSGLDSDAGGARLSGWVWAPADSEPGDDLPGVVITNGSVQASQTLYWWFADTLVANGYVVMTYDPRGQGRSDTTTPDGTRGTNADPTVFVTNQVDAIDLFRATPTNRYPHNTETPTEVPAPIAEYNPFHERLDRDRLGIVGHSLGATGVSVVQGISDADWPGAIDDHNPVDAAVAWDNLADPDEQLAGASGDTLAGFGVTPRVPAMGQSGDYYLTPQPKTEPPEADAKTGGLEAWRDAGVDSYQVNVRGGTHYEWSLIPTFPATSWEFGNPMADHYSLAWLDRYLKRPDEQGYHSADDRLLQDDKWRDRLSFYYRSARDFTTRSKQVRNCRDIRAGCDGATPPGQE